MSQEFILDPRLASDSVSLRPWVLCDLRLMNDQRFPWILLIPRRGGIKELHQLGLDDRLLLMREITAAADILQRLTQADKINVGALGNIVPQLHIHVIARFTYDPAWPGPVWGHGNREPYPPKTLSAMVDQLNTALQPDPQQDLL